MIDNQQCLCFEIVGVHVCSIEWRSSGDGDDGDGMCRSSEVSLSGVVTCETGRRVHVCVHGIFKSGGTTLNKRTHWQSVSDIQIIIESAADARDRPTYQPDCSSPPSSANHKKKPRQQTASDPQYPAFPTYLKRKDAQ